MATQAEIKAMNREDLEAEAAKSGIDPADYAKANDLKKAVLQHADDADPAAAAANEAETPEADAQNRKQRSEKATLQNKLRADNEQAEADKASERQSLANTAGTGHPTGFDKSGNPTFGTPNLGVNSDGEEAAESDKDDKSDKD